MFTVDASVWVNAYSPAEQGQAVSLSLLEMLRSTDARIVVPTPLPVELAGAIARTRGNAELAMELAAAVLALPSLRLVSLDESISSVATQLAAQYGLRGADAVYAAVARVFSCDLVSLDHEHLTRLTDVVPTLTPSDALERIKR